MKLNRIFNTDNFLVMATLKLVLLATLILCFTVGFDVLYTVLHNTIGLEIKVKDLIIEPYIKF